MTTETSEAQTEVANAAAEQAAAEAAFGQTRGVEPTAPTQTEAPEQSAEEVEAKAKEEEQQDAQAQYEEWLKGVPAPVRESLSAISGVTGRLRNIEGHIGGLTSQQKEIRAALTAAKAAENAGDEAPSDTQIAAASGSSEKWNQMKDDFPEWAEAMEERLANVRGSGQPQIDRGALKAELKAEIAIESVEEAHEGWEVTVKTPEFSTWFNSQPEETQVLADSTRARDAIRLLDRYAASKSNDPAAGSPPKQDPKARLEAAVAPTRAQSVPRRDTQTEQEAADAAWKRVRGG